jgi:hypothetical protein
VECSVLLAAFVTSLTAITGQETKRRIQMNRKLSLAAMLALLAIFPAASPAQNPNPLFITTSGIAAAPGGGFWIQYQGGTRAVGGAPAFDSVTDKCCLGWGTIAAVPGHNGYWVVLTDGTIYPRGDAPQLCGGDLSTCSGFKYGKYTDRIEAIAATADGKGLWALDSNGAVWTAGTAKSYGDVTKDKNTPTGIVGTPSGNGYYIVLFDGGVYSFGDAKFFGSTGGKKTGYTGLALSLNAAGQVNGYWMSTQTDGILTFGDAPLLGTLPTITKWFTVGMTALPYGRGYATVQNNGDYEASQTFPRVKITSRWSGKNIDVRDQSKEPGAQLIQMSPQESTSQLWDLYPTNRDNHTVQLVNVNSRLCMDVSSQIIQFGCKGPNQDWSNQRWTEFESQGSIRFQLVSQPGYSLAVYSTQDDEPLDLRPNDPMSDSELWSLSNSADTALEPSDGSSDAVPNP